MSTHSMDGPEHIEDLATDDVPRKRRFPWLILLPIVLFAGLAGVFYKQLAGEKSFCSVTSDPSKIPSVLVGKEAPTFSSAPLQGLTRDGAAVPNLSSPDLTGHVSIVNVFASWCVPCREEHPLLMKLAEDKRFQLVGLNYKDDPENARRFLGQVGNPYAAVGADPSGRIGIDWGVYGVPESFVVAANGRIAYKFIGPLSEDCLKSAIMPVVEHALANK